MFKSKKKRLLLAFALILTTSSAIMLVKTPAFSLSGSEFIANRIIDDGVFYNGNTMTVNDVQVFLNSKVPSCDTNGEKMYNSTQTRAQWAQANGRPLPPYTCLKNFSQSHGAKSDSGICSPISAQSSRTAAQIIDDVARACNISQKALIVTLQKEQSLVTDDWPWPVQYEKAMGYYCPDDPDNPGWCHPDYAGFFNQVYNAAKQFNRYKLFPENFNHALGRTSYVAFQANAPGCGGTNLNMQTAATAGLYNYTPYQPNTAALNNLYGTGDSCSAYGNRNFWRMYNDWFGSTHSPSYAWQWASQYAYTDQTKTTPKSLANLMPGEKAFIGFTARNTGNVTWSNTGQNAVMVGTANPMERSSRLSSGSSWLSGTRPTVLKETSVAPGQIGTFEFWVTAPVSPGLGGVYHERFNLLANGVTWFNDTGLSYYTNVQPPTYSWQWASQYAYTDDTKTTAKSLNGILPGDRVYVGFTAKNTGNVTWTNNGANPLRVGTIAPLERTSTFRDDTWLGPSRQAVMTESSVPPGDTGTFEFWLTIPDKPGVYNERFGLVAEGMTWLNDTGLSYGVGVAPIVYSWQWASQYAYTDDTKTTAKSLNGILPGDRVYVGFTAKNTGNVTWTNNGANPLRVGTLNPIERASIFAPDSDWLGPSRPAQIKEANVPPGGIGTFEFWITAPDESGEYSERFGLLAEGRTWLNDTGLSYGVVVQ